MQKLSIFLLFFMLMLQNATAQSLSLTPELLWSVGRISLHSVSPDGKTLIYSVNRPNVTTNKMVQTFYTLDVASKQHKLLGEGLDGVKFHPNGKTINYLQDGKLMQMNADGSDSKPIVTMDIEDFTYSPKGNYIAFYRKVRYGSTPAQANSDLPLNTAKVATGLFYRHWKSWDDHHRNNVHIANFQNSAIQEPVNIMQGEPYDAPTMPFGGIEQITWSPQERFVLYTCRKQQGTNESQSTNTDIYVYDVDMKKTMNASEGMPGYDIDPVYSPDGKYLIWTSMERAGYEADRTRIMMVEVATSQRTELTAGWDYEANQPRWAKDGKSIYFLSSKDFTYQIFNIDIATRKIRQITEGTHDFGHFEVAGDMLVGTRHSMSAPDEIYSIHPQTGAMTRLTEVTAQPWNDIKKGEVQRKTVRTTDGKDLNVWVVLPPNFDATKKYPAILYCQGGPQSALSQFFSYRWNLQLMAAQGYVVIAPCRRGMPGSGQAWNDAIMNDWGGKPMQDYLDATDAMAAEPYVDKTRMAAVGASYGGYSVYWLAGNHQRRFKAFISHCGLFNLESFYGTTEEVWFPNNDLGGSYWQNPLPKSYTKDSPHRYIQNWDTPILVIHNELDFRVPFGEGMQAFQAAQLKGIPSRFLSFPDEGHWMSKPQNSLLWQREFFGWLQQHVK